MHPTQAVFLSLACLSPLARAQSVVNTTSPTVDLGYAQYQGISNSSLGITTYYGLQYAAPPTGPQRWRPPVPIENSTYAQNLTSQVINATAPGYQCVQGYPAWIDGLNNFLAEANVSLGSNIQVPDEDCLRLDVIVPNQPSSSSLPVVIQIHGGGYTVGSSLTSPGDYFTSYSNGSLIYVQIQYRLGFYGFLSGQAVQGDGAANAGILDQRAAIEWVQRNINAFGGDPDRVTIWGGSAGGGSVTAQLQFQGGEDNPPFRAAIAEYPWWQPFHNDTTLETQYQQLLQAANCTDLSCLRSLSATALAQATQQVYIAGYAAGSYGYGDFYAGPSVDNTTLLSLPNQAFTSGQFSRVPLLIDHEAFEGFVFSNFSVTTESEVQPDLETLWQTSNPAFFTRLFQLYPPTDFGADYFASSPFFIDQVANLEPNTTNNTAFFQRQALFGDAFISCPTYTIATAASSVSDAPPIYKLIFAAGTELHGSTGVFLFGPLDAPGIGANATLSAWMKQWFINFVVDADPNGASNSTTSSSSSTDALPSWPPYLSAADGGFQVLSVNQTAVGNVSDPDASPRCDFFRGQGPVVHN